MALDSGTGFDSSFNFVSPGGAGGKFEGTVDTTVEVADGWASVYQPIAATGTGGAFFENGTLMFWGIAGTVMTPFPEIYSSTAIRTSKGGVVILQSDGKFTYTPPAGVTVTEDTFDYYQVGADLSVSKPLTAHLQFDAPEPAPAEEVASTPVDEQSQPIDETATDVETGPAISPIPQEIAPPVQTVAPSAIELTETNTTITEPTSSLTSIVEEPTVALIVAGTDQAVANLIEPISSPEVQVAEPPVAEPQPAINVPLEVVQNADKTVVSGSLATYDVQTAGWVAHDAISSGFALAILPSDQGGMEYLHIGGTVMTPFPEVFSSVAIRTTSGGVAILNTNGTFTYTTPSGFIGSTDSFKYALVDSNGNILPGVRTATISGIGSATVEVATSGELNEPPIAVTDVTPNVPEPAPTVVDVQPAPVVKSLAPIAQDDVIEGSHATPLSGNVLADNGAGADADPEHGALSVVSFSNAANGTISVDANGAFTYVANQGFIGTDSIQYTVMDSNGLTDTASLTVTVSNSGPVAADDVRQVAYGTGANGNVCDNDRDPDGDAFTVTPMAMRVTPNGGFFSIKADGTYKYTPKIGFVGSDTITYEITDSYGAKATASLTIETLAPANSKFGSETDDVIAGTSAADVMFGGAGRDTMNGAAEGDLLAGGDGADTLKGDGGADTLAGGIGNDRLYGGTGADRFVLGTKNSADIDRIMDFTSEDQILIEASELGVDAIGRLSSDPSYFAKAGAATINHWRLVYNSGNKGLYFDADGSSSTADVLIGSFANRVSLTAADFEIV